VCAPACEEPCCKSPCLAAGCGCGVRACGMGLTSSPSGDMRELSEAKLSDQTGIGFEMISQRARYALRALMAPAQADPGHAVMISDLSKSCSIPKKFEAPDGRGERSALCRQSVERRLVADRRRRHRPSGGDRPDHGGCRPRFPFAQTSREDHRRFAPGLHAVAAPGRRPVPGIKQCEAVARHLTGAAA